MFRRSKKKMVSVVVSARVRPPMARDILREANKRETPVSEEVRRRLEAYASHKHSLDAPADQQRNPTA